MRRIIGFSVALLLASAAAFADRGSLLASESAVASALGRWALKDAANCAVPRYAYTLNAANGKIIWVSDVGNTDVGAIIDSNPFQFRTITITSTRVSGPSEPTGMNWTYTRIASEYMKVTRGGSGVFLLARCFE